MWRWLAGLGALALASAGAVVALAATGTTILILTGGQPPPLRVFDGLAPGRSYTFTVTADNVGENQNDTSFRAIPYYFSTNLGTWTYQRGALIHQRGGDRPHRIVERPKVLFNAKTHEYVMYLHIDDPTYAEAKVGV